MSLVLYLMGLSAERKNKRKDIEELEDQMKLMDKGASPQFSHPSDPPQDSAVLI